MQEFDENPEEEHNDCHCTHDGIRHLVVTSDNAEDDKDRCEDQQPFNDRLGDNIDQAGFYDMVIIRYS
jgi:hypothetical protein